MLHEEELLVLVEGGCSASGLQLFHSTTKDFARLVSWLKTFKVKSLPRRHLVLQETCLSREREPH